MASDTVWDLIFDRYLTTLPPKIAAGRTNVMIHTLFHPIITRIERWDIWQRVCVIQDLY